MRALSLVLVASLLTPVSTVEQNPVTTLITGDQVRVVSPERIVLKRAPGREKVRFLARRLGTGLQVIPVDQLPAIHAGKLDARVFEVIPTKALKSTAQIHALTLTHIGRDGEPAQIFDSLITNLDTQETTFVHGPEHVGTIYLPAGRYVAYTVMFSGNFPERPDMTMLAIPSITLDSDQAYTFDGRASNHMSASVPHPTAKQLMAEVGWEIRVSPELGFGGSMLSDTLDGLYVGHAGPDVSTPGFMAKVHSHWAEMGPDGTAFDSPNAFLLGWYQEGRLFTGLKKDVRPADLARIRAKHRSHLIGGLAQKNLWSMVPGKAEFGFAVDLQFTLPFERNEYVNNDGGLVRWHSEFLDDAAIAFGKPRLAEYKAGSAYSQTWNNAVFSPGPDGTRNGDTMSLYLPFYTDASGHPAYGVAHTQRTALYRNGENVFEAPDFNPQQIEVPPGDARYRLEVSAQRGNPWPYDLSSDVTVAWTFRSRTSTGPLPLSVVRFAPSALDRNNAAPAGCRFDVGVTVQRQAGGSPRKPSVYVSYNDGLTWQQVSLRDSGSGWTVSLTHPLGIGYVSLRAKHTDSAGNSVEQTIIHAYRLR